ncbi:MAG: electron transfer flavoprotein subunit alpha/FixB family protein [Chitinophagaceae bacterium]|nr:MAG: electron transfer flavoprotein subunit alpha/FixB family protein [Chitinophagaceae bacterium]
MSVLLYAELTEGQFKKPVLQAATYAAKLAEKLGTDAQAVVLGKADSVKLETLGEYGIKKVFHDANEKFNHYDSGAIAKAISKVATDNGANVVVISYNSNGKGIAPRVSVRMKAGMVPGATELPDTSNGFTVKKGAFSGKAFADYEVKTENKIIGLMPNAFGLESIGGTAEIQSVDSGLSDADFKIVVKDVEKASGGVLLPEAELVVSAGRGLKGPENWGMIDEMAETMGAATACSRAVSDVDWRPHHEHVGQTGITIRPNLYIAIAISGAIQHLAGVSGSKVIVVINKDPEAPFFKAADYGIVGDAFEVVPKLNKALKEFYSNN